MTKLLQFNKESHTIRQEELNAEQQTTRPTAVLQKKKQFFSSSQTKEEEKIIKKIVKSQVVKWNKTQQPIYSSLASQNLPCLYPQLIISLPDGAGPPGKGTKEMGIWKWELPQQTEVREQSVYKTLRTQIFKNTKEEDKIICSTPQ